MRAPPALRARSLPPAAPTDRFDAAWLEAVPFFALHAMVLLAFFVAVSPFDLALGASLYAGRMVLVTAGYHRYFSHRSYRVSRVTQFLLAALGTTAAQKGPLWWAAHHRLHHRHADGPGDPHSPNDGLWWSHVGWILSRRTKATEVGVVADLARYPELRLVDRWQAAGPWALALACYLLAGPGGLVVGFAASTVALWHATFAVNSLGHRLGTRRYATRDSSRNSLALAVLTLGEGWHNNHHHYPPSARQGFEWWQVDPTYYLLRALAVAGVVHHLRRPSPEVLSGKLEA